jgi:hypothetical protein
VKRAYFQESFTEWKWYLITMLSSRAPCAWLMGEFTWFGGGACEALESARITWTRPLAKTLWHETQNWRIRCLRRTSTLRSTSKDYWIESGNRIWWWRFHSLALAQGMSNPKHSDPGGPFKAIMGRLACYSLFWCKTEMPWLWQAFYLFWHQKNVFCVKKCETIVVFDKYNFSEK